MAKKTPKQVKPKTGLARCMELASNKKGREYETFSVK